MIEVVPGGEASLLAEVDRHDLDPVLKDERTRLQILDGSTNGCDSAFERHGGEFSS